MDIRSTAALMACLSLILLSACSTGLDANPSDTAVGDLQVQQLPLASSAPAGQVPLPHARGLPSLASLDELAEARPRAVANVCELATIEINGYLAKSDNAFMLGDGRLLLPSTPGAVSWVIYEAFNAGSELYSVVMEISVLEAGNYFAVPDFSTGRWQLRELNQTSDDYVTFDMEDPEGISPLHRQYFALIAVGGGQVFVHQIISSINCISPVISNIVPEISDGFEFIDCAGLPGFCFSNTSQELVFGLAGSPAPAGPEDWQISRIDPDKAGRAMSMTLHKGRPVVLYASNLDESLWLAFSHVEQPLQDSDWEHRQLMPGADCKFCSIVSDGVRLHIAWFQNDVSDADMDSFWGYLYYGYSASDDPQDSFNSYRLYNLGNALYAEFAKPALAIVDGEPAIAIVNVLPGEGNRLQYLQASDPSPAEAEWGESILLTTDVLPPYVSLSLLNERPLICYRNAKLNGMQGKIARPTLPTDWNRSEIFSRAPLESFAWVTVNERPYFACVFDLFGQMKIAYYGGSRNSFMPPEDVVAEVQILVSNQIDIGGNAAVRMAVIAGRPALAYYDSSDGKLNYVQLVID